MNGPIGYYNKVKSRMILQYEFLIKVFAKIALAVVAFVVKPTAALVDII